MRIGIYPNKPRSIENRFEGCYRWNGNLLYKVLPIQGAVEYYYAQQLARLDAALERKRVKMKQQRQRSQAKYLAAKTAAREPEELPL